MQANDPTTDERVSGSTEDAEDGSAGIVVRFCPVLDLAPAPGFFFGALWSSPASAQAQEWKISEGVVDLGAASAD